VSTVGEPEPTIPAERTTSYPEYLIVAEVQDEWRSVFGPILHDDDAPPNSAEVLDSLLHMCSWLDRATAAGASDPVLLYARILGGLPREGVPEVLLVSVRSGRSLLLP
jgi:hypothetical protein